MTGYVFKRLISAVPVLLGISIIVFLIMAMIPGDPATAILGSYATPDNVAKLNRDLGLDQPLVQRYFIWLGNILQGDFGRSFALNREVLDEVLERFGATLVLAGTSFVFCAFLGIAAGVISASKQYGLADKTITFTVLIGISIPSFFLGMMMILVFAVNLRWFPVSGMWPIYGARDIFALMNHLAMPSKGVDSTLGNAGSAETRFHSNCESKRRSERSVVWRHALRAAMVSIIPVLGVQAGFVLSGAVYIEMVFQWPGVGRMLVDAILKRDLLLVQGGVIFVAACYVLFNILVDIAQNLLDLGLKHDAFFIFVGAQSFVHSRLGCHRFDYFSCYYYTNFKSS